MASPSAVDKVAGPVRVEFGNPISEGLLGRGWPRVDFRPAEREREENAVVEHKQDAGHYGVVGNWQPSPFGLMRYQGIRMHCYPQVIGNKSCCHARINTLHSNNFTFHSVPVSTLILPNENIAE